MNRKRSPLRIPRSTNLSKSADIRWKAVTNRDAAADTFVYGVLTTRIYCRPSCPARLARRANVRFYDTPSQAAAAGFRPCKRCKPEAVNPQQEVIQRACETIKSEIKTGLKPKLQRLAEEAGLTPSHFHRVFKRALGVTPAQYATRMLQAYQETTHSRYDGNQVRYPETAGLRDINILDPCIPRVPDEMSEAGASVLWNEFDRLIAAENEYGYNPEHDMQNLDELFLPMVEFQDAAETGGDIVGGNMVNFPREKQAIQIPSVPAMQMAGTEGLDTPP